MSASGLILLVLGSVAEGTGILLVVAAFFIREVVRSRPATATPQAGFWDVINVIATRLPTIYLPGLLLMIVGLVMLVPAIL